MRKVNPFNEFAEFDPSFDERFGHLTYVEPTCKIDIYRVDAVVQRSFKPSGITPGEFERGKVGDVPSRKSLSNLVFTLNNSDHRFVTMYTLTMTPAVHRGHTVEQHKNAFKAALEKMRREGVDQYVWVREYTESGTLHWHVFTTNEVEKDGRVNDSMSRKWSKWFSSYYKRLNASARDAFFMANGDGKEFRGCVRVECLRSDAAGLYAAKEGGKRFQKKAPSKWRGAGCWWYKSRGVECTPIRTVEATLDSLDSCKVDIGGSRVEVAFKIQFNRGLKEGN